LHHARAAGERDAKATTGFRTVARCAIAPSCGMSVHSVVSGQNSRAHIVNYWGAVEYHAVELLGHGADQFRQPVVLAVAA